MKDEKDHDDPETVIRELDKKVREFALDRKRHDGELGGLKARLKDIGGDVSELRGDIDNVSGGLTELRGDLSDLKTDFARYQSDFYSFREQYERDQVKADAQAKLARLRQDRDSRFAQHRESRELARSLVHRLTAQTIRLGIVDTDLVRTCAQQRMLSAPGFWLPPAVVSLATHYQSDTKLSILAEGLAITSDKPRANLFFALTYTRLGKPDIAAGWMDSYLQALNPRELGQDFFVVLDAVANRELGQRAWTFATETIRRWDTEYAASTPPAGSTDGRAQLVRWRERLLSLGSKVSEAHFPSLARTTGAQWRSLAEGREIASAFPGAEEYFRREFPDTPRETSTGHTRHPHTDRALERLIDHLEPDEAQLQREIQRCELLIEHRGDRAAAEASWLLRSKVNAEVVDFATLLDNAVFLPSQARISQEARLLALAGVWKRVREAAHELGRAAELRRPRKIQLTVDGWTEMVPTDPAAPVDSARLAENLAAHVAERTRRSMEGIRRNWPLVLTAVPVGLLVFFLGVFLLHDTASVLVALLGALGTVWGAVEFGRPPVERRRILDRGHREQRAAEGLLRDALSERVEFFASWDRDADRRKALASWEPPISSGDS